MVTTFVLARHSSRLIYTLISQANAFIRRSDGPNHALLQRRDAGLDHDDPKFRIVFACLIPVLVLLSGLFAGLTLGYMSLDETQLNVLSISGTAFVVFHFPRHSSSLKALTSQQRLYANKIKPIRTNGHLLLVTLLLANMIVNESLPVISDPILGGGVQSVVVSTVLIVMYVSHLVLFSSPTLLRVPNASPPRGVTHTIIQANLQFCRNYPTVRVHSPRSLPWC
jgi:hypothetical protein